MKANTRLIFAAMLALATPLASAQTPADPSASFLQAVRAGDIDKVKALVDGGADVNTQFSNQFSPLLVAAARGNAPMVRFLIEHGANVNYRLPPDRPGTIYTQAKITTKPQPAAWLPKVPAVPLIDSDMTDGTPHKVSVIFDMTPLMYAALNGHADVVRILIAARADVKLRDSTGSTAMDWSYKNAEVVKALLAGGVAVNDNPPDGGSTVLFNAAKAGARDTVAVLIAAGVDVNRTDKFGRTALMGACWTGDAAIVRMLLATNADARPARKDGVTALMIAAQIGNEENVRALLKASADPNVLRDDGGRALIFAAQSGNLEVVKLLLAAKADAGASAGNGATALKAAAENGHPEIVEVLKAAGAK